MEIAKELQKLTQERNELEKRLCSIRREMEELAQKKRDACKELYKGKWFFKSDIVWDDYDCEHNSYQIVYVNDVSAVDGFLDVIFIGFTCHSTELSIETDDCYSIKHLHEMKEMTKFEFSEMDRTIIDILSVLRWIRPSLFESFQK